MNHSQTILHLTRETWSRSIAVHIGLRHADGSLAIAKPLTLEVHPPDQALPDVPAFQLDDTAAQDLIDELWHLGIRPSEGHGSTGQLAAVEKHRDHLTRLLDQTLSTVCNVVNAPLLDAAGGLPPRPPTPTSSSAPDAT